MDETVLCGLLWGAETVLYTVFVVVVLTIYACAEIQNPMPKE